MAPPYGPQKPDSEALREQVRARMVSGVLPQGGVVRIFGGYGDNKSCDVCGQTILPTQVMYDLEITQGAERKTLHLHLSCHAAWQLELHDRGAA